MKTDYTIEDIVSLTAWMLDHGYEAADIVYAVEKPWKFWPDMLAELERWATT
jgi:hypothetical protein